MNTGIYRCGRCNGQDSTCPVCTPHADHVARVNDALAAAEERRQSLRDVTDEQIRNEGRAEVREYARRAVAEMRALAFRLDNGLGDDVGAEDPIKKVVRRERERRRECRDHFAILTTEELRRWICARLVNDDDPNARAHVYSTEGRFALETQAVNLLIETDDLF